MRSMAGIPLLRVYCHLLYISSDGLDISTRGGLDGLVFVGMGLMNEFVRTDRFSIELKSISARLRHLLLAEIFDSRCVGRSLCWESTLVIAVL